MDFEIHGIVELFEGNAAWHYIRVPREISQMLFGTEKGMFPIIATVGQSSWKTSLLPMGDGSHFIALKRSIREAEKIALGQKIHVTFEPQ